jgi:16S rRNA processing protein RimM
MLRVNRSSGPWAGGMLITIGKVLKPWGVKGEMKIEPQTNVPERFKELDRVFLVSPSGEKFFCRLTAVRYISTMPLLTFSGYDTPEKAKSLNGWLIKIPSEEAVPLPEGTYYWFELIGMDVFSEEGKKLGTITDIFETGSNDVYVIKSGSKEVYIPATCEVIKQVDKEANKMVIHLMNGLME